MKIEETNVNMYIFYIYFLICMNYLGLEDNEDITLVEIIFCDVSKYIFYSMWPIYLVDFININVNNYIFH